MIPLLSTDATLVATLTIWIAALLLGCVAQICLQNARQSMADVRRCECHPACRLRAFADGFGFIALAAFVTAAVSHLVFSMGWHL